MSDDDFEAKQAAVREALNVVLAFFDTVADTYDPDAIIGSLQQSGWELVRDDAYERGRADGAAEAEKRIVKWIDRQRAGGRALTWTGLRRWITDGEHRVGADEPAEPPSVPVSARRGFGIPGDDSKSPTPRRMQANPLAIAGAAKWGSDFVSPHHVEHDEKWSCTGSTGLKVASGPWGCVPVEGVTDV